MDAASEGFWDRVYVDKPDEETSWFEPFPATSLELITRYAPAGAEVIDVGGGTSRLVDLLLDHALTVSVLDTSRVALDRSRARLGHRAQGVQWIVQDATAIDQEHAFDVWHDRAVYHFLVDPDLQRRYVTAAARAVKPDGYLVIATFSRRGPTHCSGLPVAQYDRAGLERAFAGDFTLVESFTRTHVTPRGTPQEFTHTVFTRHSDEAA